MLKTLANYFAYLIPILVWPGFALAASTNSTNLNIKIFDYDFNKLNLFDSHEWVNPEWTAIKSQFTYTEKFGRQALEVKFSGNDGWVALRVNEFLDPEDWRNITQVKCDVYIESAVVSNKNIVLELKTLTDNPIAQFSPNGTIGNGGWTTVVWNTNLSSAAPVSQVIFTSNSVVDGDKYYFSNFRIRRNNVDELWETFTVPTYGWVGTNDFSAWRTDWGRMEPISHHFTYNNSAGALSIPWDAMKDANASFAGMKATTLMGIDFQTINNIKVFAYTLTAGVKIRMSFNDGEGDKDTPELTVATAGSWVPLTWDIPLNVVKGHIKSFMFKVNTSSGSSGRVYIDNMEFIKF
jgi:hypothetical protein